MSSKPADLTEVFSSIQGEGLLVGLRQVFLRFISCNLECEYCDTTRNTASPSCAVEASPGRRDFFEVTNPVTLTRILDLLDRWQQGWPGIHHSVSLTGGEPLMYEEVLAEWLPALRARLPIYLETNGILYSSLRNIIGNVDFISMDIKLPSTSGHADLWEYHREFLKVAAQKKLYVKTVVSAATEGWEIIKASEIIATVDRDIPLVLQPLTDKAGGIDLPPVKALELQEIASSHLAEVRIIPQTHKFLGQL